MPTCVPRRAFLRVISLPYFGQRGGVFALVGEGGWTESLSETPCSMRVNARPSINSMLRPALNALVSAVNTPEVTTKPPVAPSAE